MCVTSCNGAYPNADNSTYKCVATCPSSPDYFADSNKCVYYCTTPSYYADPVGRVCRARCTNITGAGGYVQYGDPRTGRCSINCS